MEIRRLQRERKCAIERRLIARQPVARIGVSQLRNVLRPMRLSPTDETCMSLWNYACQRKAAVVDAEGFGGVDRAMDACFDGARISEITWEM